MKSIIKKITLILSSVIISGGLGFVVATIPATAATPVNSSVCKGVSFADGGSESCVEDPNAENTFSALISRVINIFSIVVGAISVIMIIIGGFRYIVSAGDSNGVSGAKNTILYALVGLVIVLFAQIIVRFVLTNVTQSQ